MKIVPITSENSHIFDFFEQDYESEFSAISDKEPDAEGRFHIDADWKFPNSGFYLFLDHVPAGFAVRSIIGERSDIGEFYILPCYRHRGLGKKFAFAIFDFFPGLWQVREIPTAIKAIEFWRGVIHEYTDGKYIEDLMDDVHWGRVLRQSFESRTKI